MQTLGLSAGSSGASNTFFGRGAMAGACAAGAGAIGFALVVAKPTFGMAEAAATVEKPIARSCVCTELTGVMDLGDIVLEAGIGMAVVGEGAAACATGCVVCAVGC